MVETTIGDQLMRIVLACSLLLLLGACASAAPEKTIVTVIKPMVIVPSPALFVCPEIPKIHAGDFTQADVAELIADAKISRDTCKARLDKIKEFLDGAKLTVEGGQK